MGIIWNPGKRAAELAEKHNWLFSQIYDPDMGVWQATFEGKPDLDPIITAYGKDNNRAMTSAIEQAEAFEAFQDQHGND